MSFWVKDGDKMSDLVTRVRNDFDWHTVPSTIQLKITKIRELHQTLALTLATALPEGRELSTALSKLEESMFWSNAAISREYK